MNKDELKTKEEKQNDGNESGIRESGQPTDNAESGRTNEENHSGDGKPNEQTDRGIETGDTGGAGDDKAERRRKLLERIRANRKNDTNSQTEPTVSASVTEPSGSQQSTDGTKSSENGTNHDGSNGHNLSDTAVSGTDGRTDREVRGSDSGSNQTGDRKHTKRVNKDKPQGVTVAGLKNIQPTIKADALQLRDVFSDKEAKDYLPKTMEALDSLFLNVDKFISFSNKEKAQAVIWSNMDESDLKLLAEIVIDGAKKSRILATATEKFVQSHKMLRAGFITFPRFYQTWLFYQEHSGFNLLPNKGDAS